MLIRYINLDRSYNRRKDIEKFYSKYDLKRINAIDGLAFSDKSFNKDFSYNWDQKIRQDFLKFEVLKENGYYNLSPTELACGLSHRLAVIDFLKSNEEYGLIIEDDTFPCCDLNKIKIPVGVDFFCLLGTSHPGKRVLTCKKNQIKMLRNMSAYILNRKAAIAFLKSTLPLFCIQDGQYALFSFSENNIEGTGLPLKKVAYLSAIAFEKSFIGLSEDCEKSTFTHNGEKKWIEKDWQSLKMEI